MFHIFGISLLLLVIILPIAYAQEMAPQPQDFEKKHPNMDSRLVQLYEGTKATPTPQNAQPTSTEEMVQVILEMKTKHHTIPDNMGIIVQTQYENLIQATVPVYNLEQIANHEDIITVTTPSIPYPQDHIFSEGVVSIWADKLTDGGFTGDGIKVAVIDLGFDVFNPEIADNIIDHTSYYFPHRHIGGSTESERKHGTAVAEIVVDVAPDVELYLYNAQTNLELLVLLNDIIYRGDIDIVTMSLGFYNNVGKIDGTSVISEKVNDARDAGMLFIVSAGNSALQHYTGQYTDDNENGFHDFAARDDSNDVALKVGEPIAVSLSWDNWPTTKHDYDLFLYGPDRDTILAESTAFHRGNLPPTEFLTYTPDKNMKGHVVVKKSPSAKNADLQLFVLGGSSVAYTFEHNTPKSSILIPADAEKAITVGAFHHKTGALESYSSQGPTLGGIDKPDISAPAGVKTTAISEFRGTSAAAPHVAGAAALLMSKYPVVTIDDIQTMLEITTSRPHDAPNKFGAGKLSLYNFLNTIIAVGDERECSPCFYPSYFGVPSESKVRWINLSGSDIHIVGKHYDPERIIGEPNPDPNCDPSREFCNTVIIIDSGTIPALGVYTYNLLDEMLKVGEVIYYDFAGSTTIANCNPLRILDCDDKYYDLLYALSSGEFFIGSEPPPRVLYTGIIAPNEIVIEFSEVVFAKPADFRNLKIILPDSDIKDSREVTSISGSGSEIIYLTFSGDPVPTGATAEISLTTNIVNVLKKPVIPKSTYTIFDAQPPQITLAKFTAPNQITINFTEDVRVFPISFTGVDVGDDRRSITKILTNVNDDGIHAIIASDRIIAEFDGKPIHTGATGTLITGDNITDTSNNPIGEEANHIIQDGQAPMLNQAKITGKKSLLLTFSEKITASEDDFNFIINGEPTPREVTLVIGANSRTISLQLDGNDIPTDATGILDVVGESTGVVSPCPYHPNNITDVVGNKMESLCGHVVIDSQPPAVTSAQISGQNEVRIRFSEDVQGTAESFLFIVWGESSPRTISSVEGLPGDVATLKISGDPLPPGVTGTLGVKTSLTDMLGNKIPPTNGFEVTLEQQPTLTNAHIIGHNSILLSFSEPVFAKHTDFTFRVDGEDTDRRVLTISGSGTDQIRLVIFGAPMPTDATGTISVTDEIHDIAKQPIVQVSNYVVSDLQPPKLTDVSIQSSNVNPRIGIPGDTITISFTPSEDIFPVSSDSFALKVLINGKVATDAKIPAADRAFSPISDRQHFKYVIKDTDSAIPGVNFTINYTDLVLNRGDMVNATTDDTMVRIIPLTTNAKVMGMVFKDVNLNGIYDVGELPYPGYMMYATDTTTNRQISAESGADGVYSFDVYPGRPTIVQATYFPQGHIVYDPGSSWFRTLTVPAGDTQIFDVGFHHVLSDDQVKLNLELYHDENVNGVKDAKEDIITNLDDFYLYTYTIGPGIHPTFDEMGTSTIPNLVPADFAVLVNVEDLQDAGYIWITTSYVKHDTPPERTILTAPVIHSPKPGSEYTMYVGMVPVDPDYIN